jgi:hypothetical protein
MRGQENCQYDRNACNRTAYQISEARKIFQEDLRSKTPSSPGDLNTVATPRETYLGELGLENSTQALLELDEWALEEAATVKGGCEGCPIVALCVRIDTQNL